MVVGPNTNSEPETSGVVSGHDTLPELNLPSLDFEVPHSGELFAQWTAHVGSTTAEAGHSNGEHSQLVQKRDYLNPVNQYMQFLISEYVVPQLVKEGVGESEQVERARILFFTALTVQPELRVEAFIDTSKENLRQATNLRKAIYENFYPWLQEQGYAEEISARYLFRSDRTFPTLELFNEFCDSLYESTLSSNGESGITMKNAKIQRNLVGQLIELVWQNIQVGFPPEVERAEAVERLEVELKSNLEPHLEEFLNKEEGGKWLQSHLHSTLYSKFLPFATERGYVEIDTESFFARYLEQAPKIPAIRDWQWIVTEEADQTQERIEPTVSERSIVTRYVKWLHEKHAPEDPKRSSVVEWLEGTVFARPLPELLADLGEYLEELQTKVGKQFFFTSKRTLLEGFYGWAEHEGRTDLSPQRYSGLLVDQAPICEAVQRSINRVDKLCAEGEIGTSRSYNAKKVLRDYSEYIWNTRARALYEGGAGEDPAKVLEKVLIEESKSSLHAYLDHLKQSSEGRSRQAGGVLTDLFYCPLWKEGSTTQDLNRFESMLRSDVPRTKSFQTWCNLIHSRFEGEHPLEVKPPNSVVRDYVNPVCRYIEFLHDSMEKSTLDNGLFVAERLESLICEHPLKRIQEFLSCLEVTDGSAKGSRAGARARSCLFEKFYPALQDAGLTLFDSEAGSFAAQIVAPDSPIYESWCKVVFAQAHRAEREALSEISVYEARYRRDLVADLFFHLDELGRIEQIEISEEKLQSFLCRHPTEQQRQKAESVLSSEFLPWARARDYSSSETNQLLRRVFETVPEDNLIQEWMARIEDSSYQLMNGTSGFSVLPSRRVVGEVRAFLEYTWRERGRERLLNPEEGRGKSDIDTLRCCLTEEAPELLVEYIASLRRAHRAEARSILLDCFYTAMAQNNQSFLSAAQSLFANQEEFSVRMLMRDYLTDKYPAGVPVGESRQPVLITRLEAEEVQEFLKGLLSSSGKSLGRRSDSGIPDQLRELSEESFQSTLERLSEGKGLRAVERLRRSLRNDFLPWAERVGYISFDVERAFFTQALNEVRWKPFITWAGELYDSWKEKDPEGRPLLTTLERHKQIVRTYIEDLTVAILQDSSIGSDDESLQRELSRRLFDGTGSALNDYLETIQSNSVRSRVRDTLLHQFYPWCAEKGLTDYNVRMESFRRPLDVPPQDLHKAWHASLFERLERSDDQKERESVFVGRRAVHGLILHAWESSQLSSSEPVGDPDEHLAEILFKDPLPVIEGFLSKVGREQNSKYERDCRRSIYDDFYPWAEVEGYSTIDLSTYVSPRIPEVEASEVYQAWIQKTEQDLLKASPRPRISQIQFERHVVGEFLEYVLSDCDVERLQSLRTAPQEETTPIELDLDQYLSKQFSECAEEYLGLLEARDGARTASIAREVLIANHAERQAFQHWALEQGLIEERRHAPEAIEWDFPKLKSFERWRNDIYGRDPERELGEKAMASARAQEYAVGELLTEIWSHGPSDSGTFERRVLNWHELEDDAQREQFVELAGGSFAKWLFDNGHAPYNPRVDDFITVGEGPFIEAYDDWCRDEFTRISDDNEGISRGTADRNRKRVIEFTEFVWSHQEELSDLLGVRLGKMDDEEALAQLLFRDAGKVLDIYYVVIARERSVYAARAEREFIVTSFYSSAHSHGHFDSDPNDLSRSVAFVIPEAAPLSDLYFDLAEYLEGLVVSKEQGGEGVGKKMAQVYMRSAVEYFDFVWRSDEAAKHLAKRKAERTPAGAFGLGTLEQAEVLHQLICESPHQRFRKFVREVADDRQVALDKYRSSLVKGLYEPLKNLGMIEFEPQEVKGEGSRKRRTPSSARSTKKPRRKSRSSLSYVSKPSPLRTDESKKTNSKTEEVQLKESSTPPPAKTQSSSPKPKESSVKRGKSKASKHRGGVEKFLDKNELEELAVDEERRESEEWEDAEPEELSDELQDVEAEVDEGDDFFEAETEGDDLDVEEEVEGGSASKEQSKIRVRVEQGPTKKQELLEAAPLYLREGAFKAGLSERDEVYGLGKNEREALGYRNLVINGLLRFELDEEPNHLNLEQIAALRCCDVRNEESQVILTIPSRGDKPLTVALPSELAENYLSYEAALQGAKGLLKFRSRSGLEAPLFVGADGDLLTLDTPLNRPSVTQMRVVRLRNEIVSRIVRETDATFEMLAELRSPVTSTSKGIRFQNDNKPVVLNVSTELRGLIQDYVQYLRVATGGPRVNSYAFPSAQDTKMIPDEIFEPVEEGQPSTRATRIENKQEGENTTVKIVRLLESLPTPVTSSREAIILNRDPQTVLPRYIRAFSTDEVCSIRVKKFVARPEDVRVLETRERALEALLGRQSGKSILTFEQVVGLTKRDVSLLAETVTLRIESPDGIQSVLKVDPKKYNIEELQDTLGDYRKALSLHPTLARIAESIHAPYFLQLNGCSLSEDERTRPDRLSEPIRHEVAQLLYDRDCLVSYLVAKERMALDKVFGLEGPVNILPDGHFIVMYDASGKNVAVQLPKEQLIQFSHYLRRLALDQDRVVLPDGKTLLGNRPIFPSLTGSKMMIR